MEIINQYLKTFKGKQGLYVIRPKGENMLREICNRLNYDFSSEVAYIGKAELTKTSDLFKRAKQEMGWSNFEGATFVRKIGIYLGYNVKDKKNKQLRDQTREFICSNFIIECVTFDFGTDIQEMESKYISKYKPCLNVRKK